jgi:hypothetical protein
LDEDGRRTWRDVEELMRWAEQENELINLYGKTNAQWDVAVVEEEIRAALKSSLKKKVASLDEDRWMFEGDREGRK